MSSVPATRMGRLQRWVLDQMVTKGAISTNQVRGFYGKEFGEAMTTAERVSIHRSIRNLERKGWIEKRTYQWGSVFYVLTACGVAALKASEFGSESENVNFSEYDAKRDEFFRGYEGWRNSIPWLPSPRSSNLKPSTTYKEKVIKSRLFYQE